jgi:hypothetical protein
MTTSGNSVFNLDLNNLVEESFERCGKELRTGYDLRTARRSLNLLTIEWANRGINLWTMDQGAIPLVTGQAIYPVPNDTIQLLDTVIRQNNATTNQSDINISNIAGYHSNRYDDYGVKCFWSSSRRIYQDWIGDD